MGVYHDLTVRLPIRTVKDHPSTTKSYRTGRWQSLLKDDGVWPL